MTQKKVSRSALNVAFARTHLTWLGVVDDPYARQMLPPNGKRAAAALQLPGVRRLGRRQTLPGLAARTLFFDRFIGDALDDGLRQVVIVAAGYDSRAWRMARPGVTFFEIDQPATQEDKRAKAPEGGPVYVAVDATDPRLAEKLVQAGFQPEKPTAFTVEGLTIYLTKQNVAELFTRLGDLGTTGSRLAVSFDSGFERQRVLRLLTRVYYRRVGETLRFRLRTEHAPSFFSEAGWTIDTLLTGSDLDTEHLSKTTLAGTLNTSSFVAVAKKQGESPTSSSATSAGTVAPRWHGSTSPSCSPTCWKARINPGRVFDFETELAGIADAYAAMDDRRAIKSLVRVGAL